MVLMAVCGVLLFAGVAAVARWGALEVAPPEDHASEPSLDPDGGGVAPVAVVVRRYVRLVAIAVAAGVGAGLTIAGAGGRLAMRLLAVTAGAGAQGRLTEAGETVGVISADGTIGFVVFFGLLGGTTTGLLYMALRRWLPRGRLGGAAFGALLLVVAASRLEPLRADNPDFGIVGPGWLALTVFAGLVLLHGMAVAALAGRYSTLVPVLSRQPRTWVSYGPLLVLVPAIPLALPILAAGLILVAISQVPGLATRLSSRSVTITGWILLGAVGLLSAPGFLTAASAIARAG